MGNIMVNVLKHTTINEKYLVSTAKLPTFDKKKHYETMVFRLKDNGDTLWSDIYCDRTSDIKIARKQHELACDKVRNGDIK